MKSTIQLGSRVEFLENVKPSRLINCTGTVVDICEYPNNPTEATIIVDGYKDFGHGENRYNVRLDRLKVII